MPNILEVPLEADGEVLTVNLDTDLPDDPSEICTLLENENCASEYWLAFAAAYARINQAQSALDVISKGLDAPVAQTQDAKQPFFSCLAWLNLRMFRTSQQEEERQEAFSQAQEYANKAYQLNRADPTTLLARATISLDGGNIDEMLDPVQAVIAQSGDTNLYARFGRARFLYSRKNYRGALSLYQSILKDNPSFDLRPDPRIGIGLCYWKLNDWEHAKKAWERSLSIYPSGAVQAMLGVYYLRRAFEINSRGEFEEYYCKALELMQDAYNSGDSALASIIIASYLFTKQNMAHVLKLSERAIASSRIPNLISDAWFWKGRVYHYRKEYPEALKAYRCAVEANSANLAAVLGCGIVELLDDSQDALHTLETAVQKHPKSVQAALLCGVAHFLKAGIDTKRVQRAIQLLERYVNLAKASSEPISPEALLALAQLHERTKQMPPSRALEYLQEAIAVMTSDGADLSVAESLDAAIHNNRGVLAYYCGKFEEARAAFQHAMESSNAAEYAPSIQFNLARLEDAAGNPDKAKEGYAEVLKEFPSYTDAKIRNAFLQVVLGSSDGGQEVMEDLQDDGNLEVRALEGWYLRRQIRAGRKLDNEEQTHYKDTLMKFDKHDTYSLIAMGNLYLLNAREIRVGKDGDATRRDKAYYKASEFFDKALQIDSNNAYAAQGIAIILAETKRTRQALQILDRACETIQDPSVYINTGHCLFDLKDYNKAIEMYTLALERTAGKDSTLFTLLGRAWYARGRHQKETESLQKALQYAQQALVVHPEAVPLQFNVAFLQFQIADTVRRLPEDKRSVKLIQEAQAGLDEAVPALEAVAKAKNPPFKPSDLEERAETGRTSIAEQLAIALETQQEFENSAQAKLEDARKLRHQEQVKAEQDLKRKREEDEERERELEKERLALQEQASQWEEQRAADRAAANMEREPKKRRKNNVKRDEDEDEPMPEGSGSESESEPETRRKNVIDDDESEDEEEAKAVDTPEADADTQVKDEAELSARGETNGDDALADLF